MADWSQLPYDLIELIANQFPVVEEFLLFSAVCQSWRLVYLNRDGISTHRDTWLMLGDLREHEVPKRPFFSFSRLKVYKLPLPEVHECRCWGTSLGWIVTFNKYFEICLLNPITRACVNLPPLSVVRSKVPSEDDWFAAVQQTILLKLRGRFIIIVIYKYYCCFDFDRLGDSKWTQFPNSVRLWNIVSFKDQLWALTVVGKLVSLDIDGPYSPRTSYVASTPGDVRILRGCNLVESSENLLLIRWRHGKMMKFKVYKFDVFNSKWMVIDELGNNLLLMGGYNCYSVSAYGNLERNCIYFAHEHYKNGMRQGPGVQSITKYNIKDKSSNVYGFYNDSPFYFSPEWMMATL